MEIMRSADNQSGSVLEELREDPKTMVSVVKQWFNSRTEWLLVLDGIQFDIPGLSEFIPDARHTSIIYTSTERAVTGDPRFDNPQVMELGLLTPRQAVMLLLVELDRAPPPTATATSTGSTGTAGKELSKLGGWQNEEEARRALELVNLMGRLPLMIHVAAQHLKATREPLARYLAGWRARKPGFGQVANLHAYKKVREQLDARGNQAALNLMMGVLVWWEQLVPVEMVVFGEFARGFIWLFIFYDSLDYSLFFSYYLFRSVILLCSAQRKHMGEVVERDRRGDRRCLLSEKEEKGKGGEGGDAEG